MDSPDHFFFSLLRISAAQMLRHAGIAGSRPTVLDAVTDMMVRYITLLGSTARTITESSNRSSSELSDVLSAMEHVGLLRPLTIYTPDLDDTRAIDNFIEWAKSPEVEELRRIAGVVTIEVPDEAPDTVISSSALGVEALQEKLKPRETETDIPIKRESVDHPTPIIMDIDGVPSTFEEQQRVADVPRDTEPPQDADVENAKARVKLKQVDWFTALRVKEPRAEDAERFRGSVLGGEAEARKVLIEGGDSVQVSL